MFVILRQLVKQNNLENSVKKMISEKKIESMIV